jgi:hypothetical protein
MEYQIYLYKRGKKPKSRKHRRNFLIIHSGEREKEKERERKKEKKKKAETEKTETAKDRERKKKGRDRDKELDTCKAWGAEIVSNKSYILKLLLHFLQMK